MKISRSRWDSFIKCPLCFYLLDINLIEKIYLMNIVLIGNV